MTNIEIYQSVLNGSGGSERSRLKNLHEKHKLPQKFTSFHNMYIRWKGRAKVKPIQPPTTNDSSPITEKIRSAIKSNDVFTVEELSDKFDIGVGKVRAALTELIDIGHNIRLDGDKVVFSNVIPKYEKKVLNVSKMTTGFYKFGAVGDNHLCSKYERLEVLNALYDLFEAEGITTVYNTGNWIDGEARFNKHDISVHGMDNQVNYFVKNYPQRKGITTYFIAGDDHEGWYTQREGIDIGKYAEMKAKQAGREDLVYLGYMEADVILPAKNGETKIRVLHPGGGSSYAISYTTQKIIESYQGGEKPDILFIGHYHKADYIYCRGVHAVQTATTCDQTPFMRKKRLAAHLGGWVVEFGTDDNGAVTRFKSELIPFYDNNYYERWAFKH